MKSVGLSRGVALAAALLGFGLQQPARAAAVESLAVSSPDGTLRVEVSLRDGQPVYRVTRKAKPVLSDSRLGFEFVDSAGAFTPYVIEATARDHHRSHWEQPWGEQRVIECHYNELSVTLRQGAEAGGLRTSVVFRVFNDGLGFRYEWPEQSGVERLAVSKELTEFALDEKSFAWWTPAYQREHYEYLYRRTPVSELATAHTPLTVESSDGTFLSIHEAALVDFSSMSLNGEGSSVLEADLAPWSDGVKARFELPHVSPWRTIRVADEAIGLIDNYLELNLNEPSEIDDVSWVKPGKYVGIWWEMHLEKSTWGSGPKHGATTENTRRYIDFAAENGFDGVLVEGWNRGWDGDWIKNGDRFNFTTPYPDYDLEGLAEYARQQGVRLIGHNETGGATENYERQLERAFELYNRLGIRAVKTGYVNFADGLPRRHENGELVGEWHYGQYMVRHHDRVIRTAARRQIMLDIHEPVKQTGLRRTYPNLMTAEGARGQEYNAWSADGGNPPDHTTILPFTRLLGGPMDFTPGIFDLTYPELRPNNRVNTTLAKQLALYVVLYSPLQMAADLPENYAAYSDAFQFIRDVPTDWETTCVIDGIIGDYVTIARQERGSGDWFLGCITDEEPRELETPLSFLEAGRSYIAEVYRDADDADWRTNPTAYQIDSLRVDSSSVLNLRLAAGGGQAIRFRPANGTDLRAARLPQR